MTTEQNQIFLDEIFKLKKELKECQEQKNLVAFIVIKFEESFKELFDIIKSSKKINHAVIFKFYDDVASNYNYLIEQSSAVYHPAMQEAREAMKNDNLTIE